MFLQFMLKIFDGLGKSRVILFFLTRKRMEMNTQNAEKKIRAEIFLSSECIVRNGNNSRVKIELENESSICSTFNKLHL